MMHTTFLCHILFLFNYKNTVSSGYLEISSPCPCRLCYKLNSQHSSSGWKVHSTVHLCIQVIGLKVISVPVCACAGLSTEVLWESLPVADTVQLWLSSFTSPHLDTSEVQSMGPLKSGQSGRLTEMHFSLLSAGKALRLSLSVSVSPLPRDPSLNTLWLYFLLPPHFSFSNYSSLISSGKH